MKTIFTLIILFLPFFGSAQGNFNGKPQYDVLVRQFPDTFGTFRLELYPLVAPLHCQNFDTLARQGFYDSLAFHRVVPGFVIQGGDPNSRSGPTSTWGQGAPWQQNVPAEFNAIPHEREVLGAARSTNINSATSQFYVNTANNPGLNGAYTAYGRVISGMNVVDSVERVPTTNSLPNSKVDMFMTYVGEDTSAPASAPMLQSPADGTVNLFGNVNISWSAVNPVDFILYTVQFSQDPNFSTIDYQEDVWYTSTSVVAMDSLQQGKITYYWRVLCNNGGRYSNPSQSRSFTTAIAPPNVIFPADGDVTPYINPYLRFNSVPQATQYHIIMSKVPSLQIPPQIVLDTIVTDTIFPSPFLLSNRNYYWSVSSIENGFEGSFGPLQRFTSGGAINSLEGIEDYESLVYPNPAKDQLTVQAGGSFAVSLIDETGRVVISDSRFIDTGELNISQLSPGVYILKLERDSSVSHHKVLVE